MSSGKLAMFLPGRYPPLLLTLNIHNLPPVFDTPYTNHPIPGTFILPLASRLPKNPSVLFPFLYDYTKTSFMDKLSAYLAKFASMPSFFARPDFKLNNASVVLAAKALHRSMSEAFAAGDRDTLRKICADRVSDTLVSSIDARPKGRRYLWELVRYNKSWRYPRIVSQKVAKLDRGSDAPMIRQVVVRICSRQRRTEVDEQGRVVPESEREVDLVENVCLSSIINPHTWKQDEWRISGTVKDTDPKAWTEEKNLLKEIEEVEMSKYKKN